MARVEPSATSIGWPFTTIRMDDKTAPGARCGRRGRPGRPPPRRVPFAGITQSRFEGSPARPGSQRPSPRGSAPTIPPPPRAFNQTGRPAPSVRPEPRIEGVPEAVAHQVEAEDREHDGRPGEEEDPPGATGEVLVRVGQHRPPLGRWRLGAEAEEAERRRLQDGEGDG